MQIGGKGIENILVNMVLKNEIKTQIWNDMFHAFSLENGLNNLELSNLWCRIKEAKVSLPKPIPMIH
jgi:hypothetical protein